MRDDMTVIAASPFQARASGAPKGRRIGTIGKNRMSVRRPIGELLGRLSGRRFLHPSASLLLAKVGRHRLYRAVRSTTPVAQPGAVQGEKLRLGEERTK